MNIDEIINVLQAYKEGKKIQLKSNKGIWLPIDVPTWSFSNTIYRVAPEPKLIPFDYNDDLIGKVVIHKKINYKGIIVSQFDEHCYLGSSSVKYKNLLNDYTFLDNKPCGKYE